MAGIGAALPPDVRYRLENQASVLKLDFSTPASPPDVRYRLENQASVLKLDFINSGFAA